VALSTNFNVKEMPYSLIDVLGDDEAWAETFKGGQVYQGFLSATHYHRWSAPLTGKIVRSWVQPGTYFAQRPSQGEDEGTWEGTESQPYLADVAARAIFILEHESFGHVAMVCAGPLGRKRRGLSQPRGTDPDGLDHRHAALAGTKKTGPGKTRGRETLTAEAVGVYRGRVEPPAAGTGVGGRRCRGAPRPMGGSAAARRVSVTPGSSDHGLRIGAKNEVQLSDRGSKRST